MLWRYDLPHAYTPSPSSPTNSQDRLHFLGAMDVCTRDGGPFVSSVTWKVLARAPASEGVLAAAAVGIDAAGGSCSYGGGCGVSHEWGRIAQEGDTVLLLAGAMILPHAL